MDNKIKDLLGDLQKNLLEINKDITVGHRKESVYEFNDEII